MQPGVWRMFYRQEEKSMEQSLISNKLLSTGCKEYVLNRFDKNIYTWHTINVILWKMS